MKKIIFICCLILTFALTACNSNNGLNESANGNSISGNESPVTETPGNTKHDDSVYVPQKAVPKNLPVYPDAVLWSDMETWAAEGTGWMWCYNTTASGNEIVEFFKTELQNLGFEIDENGTFAFREEFSVATTDGVIGVGWLDDEIEDVNPDTPGRGYAIVVHLDEWNG
ncbi:MAG: hypothetical protein ACOX0U_00750 [Oscillospiraceae bacterium]|jgi:hypothetical protein